MSCCCYLLAAMELLTKFVFQGLLFNFIIAIHDNAVRLSIPSLE